MKTVNANFESSINAKAQRPNFIIKIYMGLDKTDPVYFTSHRGTPVPDGVTVFRDVLRGVSGKSQKLNVLKANSEIGTLKFELIDKKGEITDFLNSKFFDVTLEKALRHRETELYVGYGFNNADYELLFTQNIGGNLGYDGGKYSINCFDIQREQRKKLFLMKETRLSSSIRADVSGVDISFNATGNEINSSTTDLSGYVAGEYIRISGSTGNSDFFEVITSTANQITTVESIVTESAGPIITVSPATINVVDTSEFFAVDHGTSYTDGTAGKKVGYLRIEDETFSWEHGNTTATRFDKVSRAALGSRPAFHEVDAGITDDDRLPKVLEVMHMEMPSLKIAYALLTGVLYNQPGETLPDHWHAGIPTNLVNATEFLQYADEGLWDSTDDTKGLILRFIGGKDIEGKKYIEERVMRPSGCFMIVRANGALGLIKSTGVIHDAATIVRLDETNVNKVTSFRYDQKDVYNLFRLKWNYVDDVSTRDPIVFDQPSQDKYDKSLSMTIPLYGLYGGRHTKNTIAHIFDTMRDRYAGSPLKARVDCFTSLGTLEVGDIVQLKIDHIPDHTSRGKTLNRAVEVQRISVDFTKGVSLDVFGSTERSKSILQFTDGTAAGSAFITSEGTDMLTYLESTYGVDVVTDKSVPGVLKIKANCTIPGNASMASGIYYYDGSMQINSGVTVTVTENWQWRFTDFFTNNGNIVGRGNGIVAGTVGGFFGASRGQRESILLEDSYISQETTTTRGKSLFIRDGVPADLNSGIHSALPILDLIFDGTTLTGIPDDIRPVAGLDGGDLTAQTASQFDYTSGVYSGGAGGNGGSSGVIISDGATGSFGSTIDLGGDDGVAGTQHPDFTDVNISAGTGGSGWGGGLYMIKLTPLSSITGIFESFVARNGSTQKLTPYKSFGRLKFGSILSNVGRYFGSMTGNALQQYDRVDSNYVEQFFPTFQQPADDLPAEADKPIAISLTENVNTPQTTAANLATITVDVTPPTTDGYAYSNIYKRIQGNTAWEFEGPADNQWVIQNLAMTGITYEVAAFPVSTTGVESTEYAMDTITMSVASGGVVLGTGNYVQTSATVGNPTVGNGIKLTEDKLEGYTTNGTATFKIDASTGNFTSGPATDYLNGAGVFLGYSGGAYKFSVGDPVAEKYLAFDTDLKLGRNSELRGADAYNNSAIYWHSYFDSLDGIYQTTTGAGTIQYLASVGQLDLSTNGIGTAQVERVIVDAVLPPTWDSVYRAFKVKIKTPSNFTSTTIDLKMAPSTLGVNSVGIRIKSTGAVYGTTEDGVTETETDLLTTLTGSTAYLIEATFDGTTAKFYIDDVEKGSTTSTLPTGTAGQRFMNARISRTASGASTGLLLYEWRFIQHES